MKRVLQIVVVGLATIGSAVMAEDPALADGERWLRASEAEKSAYINGANDLLMVEYIVQSKAETAPTDDQSSISRWWNGIQDARPSEAIRVVDDWYAANPDALSTPVLLIIWNEYVK